MTGGASELPEPVPRNPAQTAAALRSGDRLASRLRGFGPLGIAASLVIVALGPVLEPLGAILVLVWARWSRTRWREIGYVRPRSWIRTLALGIVFGSAFKLLMKAIVMPALGVSPQTTGLQREGRSDRPPSCEMQGSRTRRRG